MIQERKGDTFIIFLANSAGQIPKPDTPSSTHGHPFPRKIPRNGHNAAPGDTQGLVAGDDKKPSAELQEIHKGRDSHFQGPNPARGLNPPTV